MLKYKKILVPYDGSDHAKKALLHAIDLAKAGDGTTLYIASVCNMVSAMSNFDQVSIAEGCLTTKLSEDLEEQCKDDLKEAAAMIPEGVAHEELYEVGSPGPVLLNMAEEKGCDLVVMGRPWTAERHFHGLRIQLHGQPLQMPRTDCEIKKNCEEI